MENYIGAAPSTHIQNFLFSLPLQDIFCVARRTEVVVFKSENLEEIENLKLCGHEAKVTAVAIHGEE